MTTQEAVSRYYDAWQNRQGDFGDVPLADDFRFTGPVASFETADGYRAMAREAGPAVTSFTIRPAFGCYLRDAHAPVAHAYGLMVLTLEGDHIAAITGFPDTGVFPPFGLPRTLRER